MGREHLELNLHKIKVNLIEKFSLSEEQIDLMLPSFLATLEEHMNRLRETLANNDLISLGKAGHTVKGAFLNLGMDDCAEIAYVIEQKGKEGDSSTDFNKLVEDLSKRIRPLIK